MKDQVKITQITKTKTQKLNQHLKQSILRLKNNHQLRLGTNINQRQEDRDLPFTSSLLGTNRWGYLYFISSSASHVTSSTNWFRHKTLTEATSLVLNLRT